MQIFISATGTDIGKTLVSSWLCLHTSCDYFKPIQTGSLLGTDAKTVASLTKVKIWPESFLYKAPLSPHLAAELEHDEIDISKIKLPSSKNIIVEGAGGVMTPVNKDYLMLDLIKLLKLPTIIVASSKLGTINHTLLTLAALRAKHIKILGVIVSGEQNMQNCQAIEFYGNTKILAQVPQLTEVSHRSLLSVPLTDDLKQIFQV